MGASLKALQRHSTGLSAGISAGFSDSALLGDGHARDPGQNSAGFAAIGHARESFYVRDWRDSLRASLGWVSLFTRQDSP